MISSRYFLKNRLIFGIIGVSGVIRRDRGTLAKYGCSLSSLSVLNRSHPVMMRKFSQISSADVPSKSSKDSIDQKMKKHPSMQDLISLLESSTPNAARAAMRVFNDLGENPNCKLSSADFDQIFEICAKNIENCSPRNSDYWHSLVEQVLFHYNKEILGDEEKMNQMSDRTKFDRNIETIIRSLIHKKRSSKILNILENPHVNLSPSFFATVFRDLTYIYSADAFRLWEMHGKKYLNSKQTPKKYQVELYMAYVDLCYRISRRKLHRIEWGGAAEDIKFDLKELEKLNSRFLEDAPFNLKAAAHSKLILINGLMSKNEENNDEKALLANSLTHLAKLVSLLDSKPPAINTYRNLIDVGTAHKNWQMVLQAYEELKTYHTLTEAEQLVSEIGLEWSLRILRAFLELDRMDEATKLATNTLLQMDLSAQGIPNSRVRKSLPLLLKMFKSKGANDELLSDFESKINELDSHVKTDVKPSEAPPKTLDSEKEKIVKTLRSDLLDLIQKEDYAGLVAHIRLMHQHGIFPPRDSLRGVCDFLLKKQREQVDLDTNSFELLSSLYGEKNNIPILVRIKHLETLLFGNNSTKANDAKLNEAYRIFSEMVSINRLPKNILCVRLVDELNKSGKSNLALEVLIKSKELASKISGLNLENGFRIQQYNDTMAEFLRQKDTNSTLRTFSEIVSDDNPFKPTPNIVSYNILLSALAKNLDFDHFDRVYGMLAANSDHSAENKVVLQSSDSDTEVLREIEAPKNLRPNRVTENIRLTMLVSANRLEEALDAFRQCFSKINARDKHLAPNKLTFDAMACYYMRKKNFSDWNNFEIRSQIRDKCDLEMRNIDICEQNLDLILRNLEDIVDETCNFWKDQGINLEDGKDPQKVVG